MANDTNGFAVLLDFVEVFVNRCRTSGVFILLRSLGEGLLLGAVPLEEEEEEKCVWRDQHGGGMTLGIHQP